MAVGRATGSCRLSVARQRSWLFVLLCAVCAAVLVDAKGSYGSSRGGSSCTGTCGTVVGSIFGAIFGLVILCFVASWLRNACEDCDIVEDCCCCFAWCDCDDDDDDDIVMYGAGAGTGAYGRSQLDTPALEMAPVSGPVDMSYRNVASFREAMPMYCQSCIERVHDGAVGWATHIQSDDHKKRAQSAAVLSSDQEMAWPEASFPYSRSPPDYIKSTVEIKKGAQGNVKLTFTSVLNDRCVQSTHTVPHYFEVTLTSKPSSTTVAIGFAAKPYPSFRLPGWDAASVAVHSDTGNKFCESPNNGTPYTQPFKEGDVIGAGYDVDSMAFYFTKNGQSLGWAFPESTLLDNANRFATVGADGACSLSVNFGAQPFRFATANQSSRISSSASASIAESKNNAPTPSAPSSSSSSSAGGDGIIVNLVHDQGMSEYPVKGFHWGMTARQLLGFAEAQLGLRDRMLVIAAGRQLEESDVVMSGPVSLVPRT